MPRPIRACIDLAALRHNFRIARARAGRTRLWAVVKANAYGHGLMNAFQALASLTDGFALLDLDEAERLRAAGWRGPLLLLEGCFEARDLEEAQRLGLGLVVHCAEQLDLLAHARAGPAVDVYLKIDTGMRRLGFPLASAETAILRATALPAVRSLTLMSHFAEADGTGIGAPLAAFARMRDQVCARLGTTLPVSLANSAALLRFPQSHGDWARPGIMLYGATPFPDGSDVPAVDLRPAMTFESRLIAIRDIAAGEAVGYGGSFRAERPLRVGTVACGYADGYPRHAPTGTPVLVAGEVTRLLGRVSMDMLAVDVTEIPSAHMGSRVVLWGAGLPAEQVAVAAGTISYELFCALSPRVRRDVVDADPSST
ncbi:MAG: Alanine racemase, catabolic [Rhodocyclaceae bacterium]|nr:Alanine racemase, catabolic [Rhodocyclaceae bacterium]